MLCHIHAQPSSQQLADRTLKVHGWTTRALPFLAALVFLSFTGCDTVGHVSAVRTVTTFQGGTLTTVEERAEAVQPSSPADRASAAVSPQGPSASTPPTDNPAPPTPTDTALGMSIYIGIALQVAGVVSLFAKKWLPHVPFGLSVGLIATGLAVMFLASLFDKTPWWAWFAVAGIGGAVAYFAGGFDNWRNRR